MTPEMQNAVIAIGTFIAAIGPVAGVVGTLIGIFGALIASIKVIAAFFGVTLTVAFLPFIKIVAIVVAAVAALAAIAYVAYKAYSTNFAGIADVVNGVGNALKDLAMVVVASLQGAIRPILASLTDLWEKHGDTITFALGEIIKGIGQLVTALIQINMVMMTIIGEATRLIGAIVAYIIDGFTDVIDFLKNFFNAFDALLRGDFEGAYAYVIAATKSFSSLFTRLWGLIPSIIIGYLRAIFPKFDAWFTELADKVREWANRAGGDMGTAIVDGMVSAIFGGSGRVASAIANLLRGGGGDGTPVQSDFDKMQADRNKRMMKIKLPAARPTPRFSGGGGGGGGGGASKQLSDYQQTLARLNDTIARFNAVTNEQNLLVDISQGKIKGLTDIQQIELVQKARLLDLLDRLKLNTDNADAAQKQYSETMADLNLELAMLNAVTDEQRIALELTGKAYANLTPQMRDAIKQLKLEILAQTEEQKKNNEAFQEALKIRTQLDERVQDFLKQGAKELTYLQQAEQLIQAHIDAKVQLTDADKQALRVKAAQLDALAREQQAFTDLTTLMQTLGMQTDSTTVKIQQLQSVLANTAALQRMADQIGTTVEDLRAKIQFEINESQMPTFAGQWQKQLDAMKASSKNFAADVAGTLANGLQGIGSVFGQAVAEWDGTAKSFFRSLAQGFRQLIQQIIQELIRLMVMKAVTSIFAAIGGGAKTGTGTAPTPPAPSGNIPFLYTGATGGLVTGPGTATSDSIPSLLSNGEFVIPARSVQKFGVDFFESLRKGQMPMRRYAMGGMVTPSASSVSTSNSTSNYNNVFNISVPSGAGQQQTATMVQKQVLDALRKHEKRNK